MKNGRARLVLSLFCRILPPRRRRIWRVYKAWKIWSEQLNSLLTFPSHFTTLVIFHHLSSLSLSFFFLGSFVMINSNQFNPTKTAFHFLFSPTLQKWEKRQRNERHVGMYRQTWRQMRWNTEKRYSSLVSLKIKVTDFSSCQEKYIKYPFSSNSPEYQSITLLFLSFFSFKSERKNVYFLGCQKTHKKVVCQNSLHFLLLFLLSLEKAAWHV